MGVAFAFSLPCYSKKVLPAIEPYAAGFPPKRTQILTSTTPSEDAPQRIRACAPAQLWAAQPTK